MNEKRKQMLLVKRGMSEDEIDQPPPNVTKIASYIWLARAFAFSSDKVHYENRK